MLGNRILPLAESETGQNHSWHRTEYIHRPGWIYRGGGVSRRENGFLLLGAGQNTHAVAPVDRPLIGGTATKRIFIHPYDLEGHPTV